ncbi:MAG: MDR/zinc-dependent alcohol dehydrogenase-like family protein [Acidiferrobacterales bacterium]
MLTRLAQSRGLNAALLIREGSEYSARGVDSGHTASARGSLAGVLRIISEERGFDAIIDPVGGACTPGPGGWLISYELLADSEFLIKVSRLLSRNMIWQGFGTDRWLSHAPAELLKNAESDLWNLFSEQPDLLPVIGAFPLSRIHEAIQSASAPQEPGKILLVS